MGGGEYQEKVGWGGGNADKKGISKVFIKDFGSQKAASLTNFQIVCLQILHYFLKS